MNSQKKNKIMPVLVILVMLIVIVVLILRSCIRIQPDSGLEKSLKAELGQLSGKTQAEIEAELNRVVAEGMFHMSINSHPVFPSGNAEGSLHIENVPNNRYGMTVEIYLDETGEQIYDSGLIEPNYHIQKDFLTMELAAGSYEAVAVFYAYEIETQELVGNASSKIMITVLN